jgi:hypothetical protein
MLCAGKCKVEETEKGWYITLIMKDPMLVRMEMRMRMQGLWSTSENASVLDARVSLDWKARSILYQD